MATRLTIKAETNYKDLSSTSTTEENVIIESYIEGNMDNLNWRFEQFCKYLLADGYSMESINKYINYDGEVYEKDEESEELI
jgi:molecular chaperone DnaK (HSP70)